MIIVSTGLVVVAAHVYMFILAYFEENIKLDVDTIIAINLLNQAQVYFLYYVYYFVWYSSEKSEAGRKLSSTLGSS